MKGGKRSALQLLGLAALLVPAGAQAQDFERRMPIPPPQPATPEVPAPPEAPSATDDATPLLPELKGLVFVDGAAAVVTAGLGTEAAPGGVAARGLPLLDDPAFAEKLRPRIGKPLTRGDLAAITRLVEETYRAAEHPFVNISVPPQNVSDGVVQIVVTQYRVGAISVTGNSYFSSEFIGGMSDLEEGEPLTLQGLRKSLDDYNQNPFLTVNGVLRPGTQAGTTDLVLEADDRIPARVYAGYDNQGVETLGRDEWYVGVNFGNLWGAGHILSYQYTRSFEQRYSSHSASYVAPLGPDDRLNVFGAYATQEPFLDRFFESKGHSGQVSLRWVHDLPARGRQSATIQGGIDYKRTDNNLEFVGIRVLDNAVEIIQAPIVFTATLDDRHGQTSLENLFVFSPGNLTDHNTDAAFRQLVPFADATYAYNRFSVTRATWLPENFVWIVRGMFQVSTANLPYSEQLSAGGIGSVRGYDPNTALGSQGFLLKTQINTPALSIFDLKGDFEDRLQFGLFVDYANVWQRRRLPDSPRDAELASIGVNAHLTIGRMIDIAVDVGRQLNRAPLARDKETKAAIVATFGF